MHIPTFRMATIRQVWQLIQQCDYDFPVDLKDAHLYILIIKCHHHFLHLVWQNEPYEWKVLPFGLATAPRVFVSFTTPLLSLLV